MDHAALIINSNYARAARTVLTMSDTNSVKVQKLSRTADYRNRAIEIRALLTTMTLDSLM